MAPGPLAPSTLNSPIISHSGTAGTAPTSISVNDSRQWDDGTAPDPKWGPPFHLPSEVFYPKTPPLAPRRPVRHSCQRRRKLRAMAGYPDRPCQLVAFRCRLVAPHSGKGASMFFPSSIFRNRSEAFRTIRIGSETNPRYAKFRSNRLYRSSVNAKWFQNAVIATPRRLSGAVAMETAAPLQRFTWLSPGKCGSKNFISGSFWCLLVALGSIALVKPQSTINRISLRLSTFGFRPLTAPPRLAQKPDKT